MTLPSVERTDESYRVTVDDREVVVPSEWTERSPDTIHAPWEDAVKALFRAAAEVTANDNEVRVRTESAQRALVKHGVADDETEAVARLAVLDHEDIVAFEDESDTSGERVVLAIDPEAIGSSKDAIYNWAAIVEAVTDQTELQIDRVRELEHRLQSRLEDAQLDFPVDLEDPQTRLEEINRKLESLGGSDDDVPPPEELSQAERTEYRRLEREARIARARQRLIEDSVYISGTGPERAMYSTVSNLEELLISLDEYHEEIRTNIALETWSHEEMVDLLDDIADLLEPVDRIDQVMKEGPVEFSDVTSNLEDRSIDALGHPALLGKSMELLEVLDVLTNALGEVALLDRSLDEVSPDEFVETMADLTEASETFDAKESHPAANLSDEPGSDPSADGNP